MKVSFEGVGENVVTFYNNTTNTVLAGMPAKMSGNGEVSKCADGERFFGVALAGDSDFAAVQTNGYVELGYTGTAPTLGFCKLAADGNGGVKCDENGGELLVVDVDDLNLIAGIIL